MKRWGRLVSSVLIVSRLGHPAFAFDEVVGASSSSSEPSRHWLDWSLWSSCDRTCGNGLKVRVRNCSDGFPGDVGCQGASAETISCISALCKDCPYSRWTFQSDGAPATQFLRSQIPSDPAERIDQFSFCVHVTPDEFVKGTLGTYTNPDELEPAFMIAGRGDALFGDYKFNVVLGQSIQTFVIDQDIRPGWICLIAKSRNDIKLLYNTEAWTLDSSLFGAAPVRLSSGGILTAGLGFSGTLANLFLTSNIVEYSSLTLNETCFTPDDLIATLKPTNLISNQGGATFSEKWSAWSFWDKCSASCGRGWRFRRRECVGGNPTDPGCVGEFYEQEECMTQHCPAGWRKWSPWSPCSNSCGAGQQTRVRECKGDTCQTGGDTTEIRSCSPQDSELLGCMYSNWEFPTEVSISNYLMVKPLIGNMSESSTCYWLLSSENGVNGTIFSYSHGEQYTGNSFAVMGSTNAELGSKFYIFRKDENILIENNFSPAGDKVLQCIIFRRNAYGAAELLFYVNDHLQNQTELETRDEFMIESDGELIIGQDQDCLLGCFDEPQAFTGNLQYFSIWNKSLTVDEIGQMYRDGYPSIPDYPQVTLSPENCERHGRIQFISKWGEWNDWTKCSVSCMSGVRTRRRHCYGGNEGDYGCEGTSREIKVCQQDSCEAMVKECSQSKWNFKAGSEATFKALFNSDDFTFCAGIELNSQVHASSSIIRFNPRQGDEIVLSSEMINDYFRRRNDSEDVDRLRFADNDVIMVCVASSLAENVHDFYVEGDLMAQSEHLSTSVKRGDVFVLGGNEFDGVIHDFAVWNSYLDADALDELFTTRCNGNAIMGAFPEQYPQLSGNVKYVNGWSDWSDWTPCSASCASKGEQTRKRKCFSSDADDEGGTFASCTGPATEVRFCGPLICPGWSNWNGWSSCSKSCGSGFIHRRRSCLHGEEGAPGCEGSGSEMLKCNLDVCPDPYDFPWDCGTVTANTGTHTMRIVNGRTEAYGAVPYLCQLTSYGDHNCGTSIISPNWNIGAAHCVADFDTPEQFRLICGSNHRVEIDTYEQQRSVKQYIKHPSYDTMADNVDYDMMLFQVDQPWDFTDYVKPICLPRRGEYPDSGMLCKVSGWGTTKAKDATDLFFYSQMELAEYIQSAYVPITEMGVCALGYKSITRRQFCAGFVEGGKDACQGDSGGPLACPVGTRGIYQLTGVVSYGIGCGQQSFPGVYTRVESLVDWILSYIQGEGTGPTAACQGTQNIDTMKTGGINSPNYDGRTVYGYNLDCSWLISIPDGRNNQKLILDFTHFHLDESPDCENDYVAIYEGAKVNKLIGKYCGRQAPPAIIFDAAEQIRVEFHTDGESSGEGPTGFAAKFHKAPRKLTDSGCRSSTEQMSAPELEKLLVANRRFTKCNFMIKPKQKKIPQYPVIRFAPQTDPSCCSAVQISNHRKKFDSKNLVDSSGLCRNEPIVGANGMFNVQIKNDVRDKKGRKCKIQLGFYSVSDPAIPYLNHDFVDVVSQSNVEQDTMKDKSKYTCFMEEISYPRYLGKSEQVEPEDRLSSCRIEIRPKSDQRSAITRPPPSGGKRKPPMAPPARRKPGKRPNSQRTSKNQKNRERGGMQHDAVSFENYEEEEELEDYEYELEEYEDIYGVEEEEEREKISFDRSIYTKEEIQRMRAVEQETRRQDRYLARVAYRAEMRAMRKGENERSRETNKKQRVHQRSLVRTEEKAKRLEARHSLLSRSRRAGKNSKKRAKNGKLEAEKAKGSKNKGKKNKNKAKAEYISDKVGKNQPPNKQSIGRGDNNNRQPGNNNYQRPPRNQSFRSCTAAMVSPRCLVTTAACTGKAKDVRLFAKVGERRYGQKDDSVQTIMIKNCITHPKYKEGEPNNDLQVCFLSQSIRPTKNIMIPCLVDHNITLADGDIVVTESRTNFNKGKMEGTPYRTHIPITGKYHRTQKDEPVLRAGYAFGDPLCMKEVGSPVFREDVYQRTLLGIVQGPIAPQNQCPTRLFNIVDLRDHQHWVTESCKLEALAAEQHELMSDKPNTSNRGGEGSKLIKLPTTGKNAPCPANNINLWSFDGGNCTTMTITSPGYPNWYPSNSNCRVSVSSPSNTKVRVRFLDSFDIEADKTCMSDALTIADPDEKMISSSAGLRESKGTIHFCNGQNPQIFREGSAKGTQLIAQSNQLDINFRSDESVQRTGFKLLLDCVPAGFNRRSESSQKGSNSES